VFVTGLGFVTPHGTVPADVFERLYRGESAIRLVRVGTEAQPEDLPLATIEFEPGDLIPRGQRIFMARVAQLGVVAGHHALVDAGLLDGERGPAEAGIYMGCGLGGSEAFEAAYRSYFERKSRRYKPSTVPLIMSNAPASHISMRYGLLGPTQTYSIACASSTVSVGEAFRALRDGYLDVALAGGAESMINDGSICAWTSLGVVAKTHPDGAHASSRPFDKDRTGFVLAEGSVMMALETEERVAARGVQPIAEIIGYGASSDAFNLTEPQADGQERAIRAALADAGVEPAAVGYVNAHGTGTPTGDPVELEALARVFGRGRSDLAVSSTKSMHGHLVGAAGAIEAAITALSLKEGRIPPTAFLETPEPASGFDLVPGVGRPAPALEVALSNSFAFGGSNAAVVLRKV
jgi:3-oxoacyl-[acyl-carrier-protein] synthase II